MRRIVESFVTNAALTGLSVGVKSTFAATRQPITVANHWSAES